MRVLLTIIVFVLSSGIAQAEDYKPGTAGYLYNQCLKLVVGSGTPKLEDLHDTYCGHFVEGYVMGALSSSSFKLSEPNEEDPCFEDKTREYEHINNRFCPNIMHFDALKTTAGDLIRQIIDVSVFWAEQNKDKLNQPAAEVLSGLVQTGAFCDQLPAPHAEYVLNGITTWQWPPLLNAKILVSHKKKYKQCQADIEAAKGDRAAFKATKCGAEITGFIAGLYASDNVYTPVQTPSKQCAKQIDRLYNGLNPAKSMCVKKNTDPLYIARIFTENFEFIGGAPGFFDGMDFFDPGALGAVGYETIYRGFLCRNEFERQQKKN